MQICSTHSVDLMPKSKEDKTMTTTAAPPPKPPPAAPRTPPPPPPSRPAPPSAQSSGIIPTFGKAVAAKVAPRLIINAVEGFGKTTIAAHAPNAAILMAKGETGYTTLLSKGRVPAIGAANIEDWGGLNALLDSWLASDVLPFESLALDAMGGFERMCHEMVCRRDFKGDWGERGFTSYNKGYDVSIPDWELMLGRLFDLNQRGVAIILLSHCKVKNFKNPLGPDFDRWVSNVHEKTWGITAQWADAVFFGNFVTVVDEVKSTGQKKTGKGVGGSERVIYTERCDAFDAKNRFGMPPMIELLPDPAEMWNTIEYYINKPKEA